MAEIITLQALDGTPIVFIDEIIASNSFGDEYLSVDKTYSVAVYRAGLDSDFLKRLKSLVEYGKRLFARDTQLMKDYFCGWPTKIFYWDDRVGAVFPAIPKEYFFVGGKFNGQIMEGKWFTSAKLMNKFLEPEQRGTFFSHILMCLNLVRAAHLLSAPALSLADFSNRSVLVDPGTGRASIFIRPQEVVIPGMFPPDVMETSDFMAPEVLETRNLPVTDKRKILPSIYTNRHSLAVLIYMLLLNRHPLRGARICDPDPAMDEYLSMGNMALFIEHPTDESNRPNVQLLSPFELPQGDVTKRPYSLCGPYLKPLFDKAFIDGLHDSRKRSSTHEWEYALTMTMDLLVPCSNDSCEAKWFVFDNTKQPVCPYCGQPYTKPLPVLNFYYPIKEGSFRTENRRLVAFDNQHLCMRHVNFNVPFVGNTLDDYDCKDSVGEFHFQDGKWVFINHSLTSMKDISEGQDIPVGGTVELSEGKKILLSKEPGGRLVVVQMLNV